MQGDVFDKCFQNQGNFPELNNFSDHYLVEPQLESPVAARMLFQGKEKIIWSINNYIGLAGHPEITKAAQDALKVWGMSSPMGSRLMTGDTPAHNELEKKLANFCEKPSALLYSFGYLGVIGTISGLISRGDVVLIDSLSHACIIDGATLAQAKSGMRLRPFKHNDMEDLEEQLKEVSAENKGGALIITEGVFGMHGELGNLPAICALKEKYGARLFVDDAHGFGVMGKNGHGTGEHFGVQDKIDLYYGTFTKAFALLGGVVTGEQAITAYIKFNSRTSVFSRSLPLIIVQSIAKAIDLATNHPENRKQMWHITHKLQTGLKALGFNLGKTESPVTPVYVPSGDVKLAIEMTRLLRDEYNIFVTAVTYPVVQKGVTLYRLIPTAKHQDEDVELTLKAFEAVRDRLKLKL